MGAVKRVKARVPGPGTHTVPTFPARHPTSNFQAAELYSMAGRRLENHKEERVGPGTYHPRTEFNIPQAEAGDAGYGFSRQRRALSEPTKHKTTPAGELAHLDNPKFVSPPSYSLGCTERKLKIAPEQTEKQFKVPGPGQHNPRDASTTRNSTVPAYSMGARMDENPKRGAPGPGTYQHEPAVGHTLKATPRVKFGTAGRHITSDNKHPGPGHYGIDNITRTGHNSVGGSAPKWSMPGRPPFDLAHEFV